MVQCIWGKKVGMTQVFSTDNKSSKVIPVTVIDLCRWFILQKKDNNHDGYNAIQVGLLRKKYGDEKEFSSEWLKNKKKYFLLIKELACEASDLYEIGQVLQVCNEKFMITNSSISVTGTTKGKGFQGAVKRHGFTGGRASHGDKLGRGPGSLSGLRTQGRVFKGKKMPGHMGAKNKTVLGLKIIDYRPEDNIILISGPVPGFSGMFVKISQGA